MLFTCIFTKKKKKLFVTYLIDYIFLPWIWMDTKRIALHVHILIFNQLLLAGHDGFSF